MEAQKRDGTYVDPKILDKEPTELEEVDKDPEANDKIQSLAAIPKFTRFESMFKSKDKNESLTDKRKCENATKSKDGLLTCFHE